MPFLIEDPKQLGELLQFQAIEMPTLPDIYWSGLGGTGYL